MKGGEKIFISIAAYLDLDAIKTIKDCIKKAKNPDRLVFGICWQFEENIGVPAGFLDDLKVECDIQILKYHYLESEGPSWAKNKVRQLYSGEEFCLQTDAHMRFAQDWDILLVSQHSELKAISASPVISYLPPTFYNEILEHQNQPDLINIPRVIAVSEDNLFEYQENNEKHTHFKSMASPILEPRFIFAEGKWLNEVSLPDDIYYIAEEIYQSIDSYMMGYDFFLPKQIITWHRAYYPSRIKHYTTHPSCDPKEKLRLSLESLNELLRKKVGEMPHDGSRSLKEYESFANVKFNLPER